MMQHAIHPPFSKIQNIAGTTAPRSFCLQVFCEKILENSYVFFCDSLCFAGESVRIFGPALEMFCKKTSNRIVAVDMKSKLLR